MEGYAKEEMKHITDFLHASISRIINDFNFSDLELVKIKPRPASKVFQHLKDAANVPLEENDLLPYEFIFNYKGKEFIHIVDLPVPDGKRLTLKGVKYSVIPTIVDTILTIGERFTINLSKRIIHLDAQYLNIVKSSGENVIAPMVFSDKLFKEASSGFMKIPILMYTIIKYGVRNVVGNFSILVGDEILPEGYETIRLQTKNSNGLCIMYKIDEYESSEKLSRLYQMAYIVGNINFEYSNDIMNIFKYNLEIEDEQDVWYTISALLAVNFKKSANHCLAEFKTHVNVTIEGLSEQYSLDRLREIGINARHLVDLFAILSDNYNEWRNVPLPNMKRRVEVLSIFLSPILSGFTVTMNKFSNYDWEQLTVVTIKNTLNKHMKARILSTTRNMSLVQEQHNNPSPINNIAVSTEHITRPDKGGSVKALIPEAEDIFVGNVNVLPGSVPFVLASLNPTLNITDNVISVDKEKTKLMKVALEKR